MNEVLNSNIFHDLCAWQDLDMEFLLQGSDLLLLISALEPDAS